jgi:lipoprotein NlpD
LHFWFCAVECRYFEVGCASKIRLGVSIIFVIGLLGCSSALRWMPETHTVVAGDTVYSIAWQYGLDQRDLATWNQLDNNGLIYPGQSLRLSPPSGSKSSRAQSNSQSAPPSRSSSAGTPAAQPAAGSAQPVGSWQWPTAGTVILAYGASAKTQSGIQIGGRKSQPVYAAAAGEVVYSGSGLTGYGELVIIKHNADYLSAYGHNDSLLVKEGEQVRSGQRIAQMGNGPDQKPLLHFEIRRHGAPVNPMKYLPRR